MKTILVNSLLVGLGGFVGALLRYGLSGFVHRHVPLATFPYGTLAVNLIGCLVIGALVGISASRQPFTPEFRTFALIGLLGAFTTFSTFGYETFSMAQDGEYLHAGANVALQVVGGLFAVWLGYGLTS